MEHLSSYSHHSKGVTSGRLKPAYYRNDFRARHKHNPIKPQKEGGGGGGILGKGGHLNFTHPSVMLLGPATIALFYFLHARLPCPPYNPPAQTTSRFYDVPGHTNFSNTLNFFK